MTKIGVLLLLCVLISASTAFRNHASKRYLPKTWSLLAKATGKAASEVRVRLREDVPKTGKKGEIVVVSSALWQNVLSPGKKADRISDDEMSNINKEKDAALQEAIGLANGVVAALKSNQSALRLKRKAGANGQLFGSISAKVLLEELRTVYSSHGEALGKKDVSILSLNAAPPLELVNGEVRKIGVYSAELRLWANVHTTFTFEVVAE